MRRSVGVVALCFILPAVAWAQAPSNEALHQKILEMERKLDTAIDEAGKAKDEANQAREELTRLREAAAAASESSADLPAAGREKGIGFGISVEALYMRPTRSGLDFVVVDPDAGEFSGSEKAVEADHDWGFRLGMSYEFKSGAFVGLRAATLDTSGDASVTEPSGGSLWGTWLHPNAVIDDDDVTAADASYDFEQDVFDLVVGKKLTVGRNVGLRIDAGLRYAEMKQAFDINYESGAVTTVDVYQDQDYRGWGPTVGMDADWEMGWGISLFGSVSGSLLMGDADYSIREVDFNGATTELVNVESSDNSRVVPVVEMRAGIGLCLPAQQRVPVRVQGGL